MLKYKHMFYMDFSMEVAFMALSQEIFKKLEILTDAAKYDVACTSSGSSRRGGQGTMGNAVSRGLCHCFAADGRYITDE